MKAKVIAYWICTVVIALCIGSGGAAQALRVPQTVEGMTALGYPLHFIVLLGVWKVLGALTLLAPGLRLVKEWGLRRHLHRPLRRHRGGGGQRGRRVPHHRAPRPHRPPRRVLGAAPGEPAIARRENGNEGGHREPGVWGAFDRRLRSRRRGLEGVIATAR
jgi:hypothetical protein